MRPLSAGAICLLASTSATALRPLLAAPGRTRQLSRQAFARRFSDDAKAVFVTKQSIDGAMYTDYEQLEDCAIVDPDAVNLLACHFIAHHRDAVVEFINKVAFTQAVLGTIDGYVGDLLSVKSLRFDITGPLEPQNYFHCYEVSVTRETHRPDLVHADLTVEYKNQLCITMDALRFRGAVRGNSSLANFYRWMTTPIQGSSPLMVKLAGHGEGITKLRLTLQTSQGVPVPKLCHVKITDATGMRIVLDDYDVNYLGPAGYIARFLAGQLPLRKTETVLNEAVQGVFQTYADGWPIAGGVQKERTGSWSRRRRPKTARSGLGGPKIAGMSNA